MFESKSFEIIKSRPSRNHGDQFFKNFMKNLIKFFKKFDEQSQKFQKNFCKFKREFKL